MKRTWIVPAFVPLFLLVPCRPSTAAETASPAELVVPPGAWVELALPAEGLTVEANLDGGVLHPVDGGLRAPASGDHWLVVASRDAAGRRSPLSWTRLRVDGEAPELGIVVEPEPVATETGLWIPADAVARARATDAPAGVETLVVTAGEARSETTGPEAELALPSSGAPTLTAETRDAVGNLRTTDPVALQVDGAPPVVEIVLDGPQIEVGDRLIATPALVATVRATDIASGVATTTLSIDGGVIEGSSRSGGWQPGLHTLAASAEDRVGNRAEVSERRIEIDGDGPALSHRVLTHGVEGAEGQALYRPPVEVSIEATDGAGVESVQWSSDGTSWQDLAASGGTLGTPNPTIELRAVDGVGNTRRQTASWQLDSDPPRWVLRGPDGEVDPGGEVVLIQGQSVTLEAVDAAGVAHQETGLRARTWQTAPVEIRFPTRGRYWLGARSEDRLGNAAKVQWWVRVERQGGAR